jgi:hypothetical protein
MTGTGAYADMLRQRFQRACRRLDFEPRGQAALDCSRFRPPPQRGDQLSLF